MRIRRCPSTLRTGLRATADARPPRHLRLALVGRRPSSSETTCGCEQRSRSSMKITRRLAGTSPPPTSHQRRSASSASISLPRRRATACSNSRLNRCASLCASKVRASYAPHLPCTQIAYGGRQRRTSWASLSPAPFIPSFSRSSVQWSLVGTVTGATRERRAAGGKQPALPNLDRPRPPQRYDANRARSQPSRKATKAWNLATR